jgi:hypothetical protein
MIRQKYALALVFVGSLVAGCGGSRPTNGSPPPPPPPDAPLGPQVTAFDFSGQVTLPALPEGTECPTVADPVSDACLGVRGTTVSGKPGTIIRAKDCKVLCSEAVTPE